MTQFERWFCDRIGYELLIVPIIAGTLAWIWESILYPKYRKWRDYVPPPPPEPEVPGSSEELRVQALQVLEQKAAKWCLNVAYPAICQARDKGLLEVTLKIDEMIIFQKVIEFLKLRYDVRSLGTYCQQIVVDWSKEPTPPPVPVIPKPTISEGNEELVRLAQDLDRYSPNWTVSWKDGKWHFSIGDKGTSYTNRYITFAMRDAVTVAKLKMEDYHNRLKEWQRTGAGFRPCIHGGVCEDDGGFMIAKCKKCGEMGS